MASDSKSPSAIPALIVGVLLMVGGMWFSKNVHLGFIEQLAKQGVPLDLGKTIASIGVLLILFPLIRYFFLNPLTAAIEERNSQLERTFTEAETLRAQMQQMKTDYEQRLVQTEAQAREQIQAQIREAQDQRKQLFDEAQRRADEFLKKAQDDLEVQKERVLSEVRLKVVDLTMQATERILGENIDDARNRKLVEEFIEKVEVPG
jgi:F-type H+-transporting ATPase subunit b